MTAVVADVERLVAFGSLGKGTKLIQAVRAFHAVGLTDIGLHFLQNIVLLCL